MTVTTNDPIPDDDDVTGELGGQSTTVEEAMDAATDEDGYSDESAYTTGADATSASAENDVIEDPPVAD